MTGTGHGAIIRCSTSHWFASVSRGDLVGLLATKHVEMLPA